MTKIKVNCPICEGEIKLPGDTEESEIISCPECENRIVVASAIGKNIVLEEAPEIEEDWGE